ncbi:MAG: phosphatase PAP2 family protein [Sphingobium sp.]|nr:phosphatase PAP2 family protein [Sphingobium sp.]
MRLPSLLRQAVRWPEAKLLWLMLGASALLLLVLKACSEIAEGDTLAYDRAILIALRTATEGSDALRTGLRQFMLDVTALGNNALLALVALLGVGFLVAAGKRHLAALLGAGIVTGIGASVILKLAFARARPDVVAHLVDVQTASFPSGHAMNSAVVYLTMAALLARGQKGRGARLYILAVGMGLTFLIGLSRLYLGVHWPTDVLMGWMFGASWAGLLAWAGARLQERGAVEGADEA